MQRAGVASWRPPHARLSTAVVGVPGKDRGCAIELLHQHRPRQQMWPCHLAKAKEHVGCIAFGIRMPVRSAKHEPHFAHPIVAPAVDRISKLFGLHRLAPLIKEHSATGRQRIGDFTACLRQFRNSDWPTQPLLIPSYQFSFRRTCNLSASDNVEKRNRKSSAIREPAQSVRL